MKRRYYTDEGIVEREPTEKELDAEWEIRKKDAMVKAQIRTIAELTKKTEKEVEDKMKNYYCAAWKE
jgi:hypothetical protein